MIPGETWQNKRKRLFRTASDKWNERSFNMRLVRNDYAKQARELNMELNTKRQTSLAYKDIEDRKYKTLENNVRTQQLALLDVATRQGMFGDTSQPLEDLPSLCRYHALPDLATHAEVVPNPIEDAQPQPIADQVPVDCGDAAAQSSQRTIAGFLHEHGHGLHGLGDSEFGLAQDIVNTAMNTKGFIKQFDLHFQQQHSDVCAAVDFELAERDDVDNMKACQELCGRYCRRAIANTNEFRNAIEMVRTIARIAQSRRDVKNGNIYYLSPSCMLPVLVVTTPSGLYGRVACRITFSPLEVDWIRGDVLLDSDESGEEIMSLTLRFENHRASNNLCPVVDSMTEFAIWMSNNFKTEEGYRCQLFTEYELHEQSDYIFILRSEHQSSSVSSIDGKSFGELVGVNPSARVRNQHAEFDQAMKSVGLLLSVLNGDKANKSQKQSQQQQQRSKQQQLVGEAKQKPKARAKARTKTTRIESMTYVCIVCTNK